MKWITGIFLIISLLFLGCDEPESDPDVGIVFQFEYINYAWSFQHRGFFIDKEGQILSFEKPAGWIFPEDNGISMDDFNNNLAKASKVTGHVEKKKLLEMTDLILGISNSTLSKAVNRMADAGTEGYYSYRLNNETGKYDRVILLQRGDWCRENIGKNTDIVIKWLLEVNKGGMYNF